MKPAAEVLRQRFQHESFGRMEFPVYFNCTGKPEKAADGQTEAELISSLLVRQVQSGVYMEDTIRNMIAAGADQFIEIGPGKTLSGFVRRTDRSVHTVSITTAEDLQAFLSE
jgi:[acyl-carrier-protein] S-malonyltransferase